MPVQCSPVRAFCLRGAPKAGSRHFEIMKSFPEQLLPSYCLITAELQFRDPMSTVLANRVNFPKVLNSIAGYLQCWQTESLFWRQLKSAYCFLMVRWGQRSSASTQSRRIFQTARTALTTASYCQGLSG